MNMKSIPYIFLSFLKVPLYRNRYQITQDAARIKQLTMTYDIMVRVVREFGGTRNSLGMVKCMYNVPKAAFPRSCKSIVQLVALHF
jgi:hypothetical protein